MLTSKVTTKGQTTLPKELRKDLGLGSGDTVIYVKEGESFKISKLKPFDRAWHEALGSTLQEWNSPEDDEGFRDL